MGYRIAVADDEEDIRLYFERLLPRLGHQVVGIVGSGRELVELCRRERPDLILSDVRMPGMDGDQAIQEICREAPCRFILISAFSAPPRETLDCYNVPWAYLHKPIKRADVEAAIAAVMGENGVATSVGPD